MPTKYKFEQREIRVVDKHICDYCQAEFTYGGLVLQGAWTKTYREGWIIDFCLCNACMEKHGKEIFKTGIKEDYNSDEV